MTDLQKSREEIDRLDKEIVRLFEHRMEVAKEVAEYKLSTGKKVFDKEREQEKLKSLEGLADNDFNRHGIRELFVQIMSMSRKLQYGLIESDKNTSDFQRKKELQINTDTLVACFGKKGSHAEQAMEEYFGPKVAHVNCDSFKEIMQAVKDGDVSYGVLPIENTSTGGISDIYDLLDEYDNYIVGEYILRINQALLGLKGAKVEELTKVYSHPQGLLQCAKYLDQYQKIKRVECASTSEGAERVMEENDINHAAISGKRAAKYYGLEVMEEAINFNTENSTRFIIIANQRIFLEKANKISICFEIPHESGSLYNILSNLIYNNLNMTQIESRPIVGKSFEYRFFVDMEGNLMDAGVRNALAGMKEEAVRFKVLGNFM